MDRIDGIARDADRALALPAAGQAQVALAESRTHRQVPIEIVAAAEEPAIGAVWDRSAALADAGMSMHLRARLSRVSDIEVAARTGITLLDRAAVTATELRSIMAELVDLVTPGGAADGAGGPWVTELIQLQVQVQQMLNALRFQQGTSITGDDTLGDALRADIESGRAGTEERVRDELRAPKSDAA